MKCKHTAIWLAGILFCFAFKSFSQSGYDQFEVGTELNRLISAGNTPEASSFGKYGNTPVSLYTGTPQVSVPLYTYQGRELNLPLSLTYNASGIKVEQEASQVGLGWNLNVGGRVNRMVNGLPDDYETGSTSNAYFTIWNTPVSDKILQYVDDHLEFDSEPDAIAYLEFIRDVNDNRYDTQPDYFVFNALGYSETFVIDVAGRVAKPLNNPRMKAECFKAPFSTLTAVPSITKWKITTDDGTVFEFDKKEFTRTQDDDDSEKSQYGLIKKYVSSWYLTKITSPLAKDIYEFIYDTSPLEWERPGGSSLVSRVRNVVGPPPGVSGATQSMGQNDTRTWFTQFNLNSIVHNGRTVVGLDYDTRFDIAQPNALSEITVYKNDAPDVLRTFDFVRGYFKNGSGVVPETANPKDIRLRLNKVNIKDINGVVENSYEFTYHSPNGIPALDSKAQDYYGYFNGKANTVLYPKYGTDPAITDGADRTIDFNKAIRGTLKKIKYPTGGSTEFAFETNMSSYTDPTVDNTSTTFEVAASLVVPGGGTGQGWYDSDSQCQSPGCIDTYLEIGSPPLIQNQVFNVATTRTLLLQLSLNGTIANNYGKHVLIFRRSDLGSCAGSPSPAPLLFEDVIRPEGGLYISGEDVIYHNITAGPDYDIEDLPLNFTPGCYQVMIVNPEAGSTYTLYLGQYGTTGGSTGGTTTQLPKAGIRIKTIKDYTSDGILATQKDYGYSNGTVISQPLYTFLIDDYIVNSAGDDVLHQVLYRQTHVTGTDKPHVGYEKVTETKTDFTDPSKNATTSHEFNTDHWGSYFTGAFNYYINQKQTATNYAVNFELGKQKRQTSKGDVVSFTGSDYIDKYISETFYDSKQFYKNTGVYLLQEEIKRNQFYNLVETPAGKFNIEYVQGVLQSSFGGIPVYNHPSGFCSGVLCEGGLGALSFQTTSAYGKAGIVTQQKKIEKGNIFTTTGGEELGLKTETNFDYYDDPIGVYNFLTKSVTTRKSNGEILKKEIKYPNNLPAEYGSLISANIITMPVETTSSMIDVSVDPEVETILSTRKSEFIGKLPEKVLFGKGDATALEDRVVIDEYRNNNIVQVTQPDGTEVSYIWGYSNRYIVAKVVGAAYDDIETTLGLSTSFPLMENLNASQELDLRAIPDVLVTTYDFDPMIGLIKSTNERGYSMSYEYDDFQRLVRVKDQDGNILKSTDYSLRENN